MTHEVFRDEIGRLGLTQAGLARRMREHGDPRSQKTVLRSLSNYCRGANPVPGEMWVVVRLLGERQEGAATP